MRMTWIRRLALALALALVASGVSAQTLTGTISGRIVDQQGGMLPGVTVTATGKAGAVTQVTNARGEYRFLGLNPGVYEIKAEMQGFRPKAQPRLELSIGQTLDIDFTLEIGGMTDEVNVLSDAARVDVTTTATDTNISQSLLFSMPISRTNAAVSLLNYAPGINSGSAFGGASNTANALLLDGVDTRDPEGGSAWTFFNYNIIDQVQIGSLGQAAEYGGFTGAVINTITKSGGNHFSGLFEQRYTSKKLRGNNVSSAVSTLNPAIKASGVDNLKDYTVQMGGPLRQNKAFFFGSVQRYAIKQDPDGPRTLRTEVSPRLNVKTTFQPNGANNITLSLQYDQYNQTGRTGFAGTNGTTDELTVQQDSPEYIWNGQYRRVIGAKTLFEAKYTGYWGYFDLDPKVNKSAHLDGETGAWSGGAGYSAQYDRTRNQLNASLARYGEAAGSHSLKFGVEIERSTIRNRFGYTDGLFFYDYGGLPYLAYSYSYDVKGRTDRTSLYAQDQWTIGNKFTANIGARADRIKGVGTSDNKEYYSVLPVAPRLGAAYDLNGDGKSVIRAYYGQLYDGATFASWERALPGISDYVTYTVAANGTRKEVGRVSGVSKYTVDPDLKHPRTDEFSVAYQRQLSRTFNITGTYIRRDAKNFINSTLIGGTWAPTAYTNPLTNQSMTIYKWANKPIGQKFLIQNVDNFAFAGAGGASIPNVEAYRTYNGAMFVLTRAYADRWQAQMSYVYSKTKGTVTNGGFSGVSSGQFETPNTIVINSEGNVSFDRTHEVKVFAGYQIPKIEVSANIYYRMLSGLPYTAFQRLSSSTVGWTSSVDLLLEPRGSRRNDTQHLVDARFEKVFSVGMHRLGLYADVDNLFNKGVVTARQSRNPFVKISGNKVLLGSPTAVTPPRQITFGARWSF